MKVFLLLLLLSPCVWAQGKTASISEGTEAAKVASKALPLNLELTGEDAKAVTEAYKTLRLAQLEADNFDLQIEKQLAAARKQLATLREAAEKERQTWQKLVSDRSKIPPEKLDDYMLRQDDGKWIFTKKPPQQP